MQSLNSPLDVVRAVRFPLTGLRILDIGCGTGDIVRQLLTEGADACGIDPGGEAIRKARAAVPQARFFVAGAESLPFEDSSIDIALMVNSLHHVSHPLMSKALAEAMRVICPDGVLIVHEPPAEGSFFAALRLVEDETVVRRAAQWAIEDAVTSGLAKRQGTLDYVLQSAFADADSFVDFVIAVNPAEGSSGRGTRRHHRERARRGPAG